MDSSPAYESESQIGLESSSPSLKSGRTKLSLIPPMNFSSAKLWRRLLLSVFISKCLQNLPHLFSKQTPRRLGRYCIVIELHFAKWRWWRHWLVRKSISTCIFAHRTFARLVIWKTSKGFFARNELSKNSVKVLTFQKKRRKLLPPLHSHDQKVWNIISRKSFTFSISLFLVMTVCV